MDTFAFIGAKYYLVEKVWKWPKDEVIEYTNWAATEGKYVPGKNCAYMNVNTGEWISEICAAGSTAFICQMDTAGKYHIAKLSYSRQL